MPQFFFVALPVEEYVEHGEPSLTMKGHTALSLSLLQSPDSRQSFLLLQIQKNHDQFKYTLHCPP